MAVTMSKSDLATHPGADQDRGGARRRRAAVRARRAGAGLQLERRPAHGRRHLQPPAPGQEKWGAADQPVPRAADPAYRPADGTLFDPDGPGPGSGHADSAQLQSVEQSQLARRRLEPAHHLQPDRRPDAGQSGGDPDRAAARRLGGPDGRSRRRHAPSTRRSSRPSTREYQARVVVQNAQRRRPTADGDRRPPRRRQAAADRGCHAAAPCAELRRRRAWCATPPSSRSASPWTATTSSLPNIAPDEGLSAPFNSWFTLFGQFFDHGLDLVNKGGSGTVFIPLQPDDPLYVAGSHTNFMVLTRATVSAGADGVMGTADDVAAGQHHDFVRRPEPDLYLASLAPGVPARVRLDGRRRAGRDRQADRGRQRRHGDLGRGQGAGARCSASS